MDSLNPVPSIYYLPSGHWHKEVVVGGAEQVAAEGEATVREEPQGVDRAAETSGVVEVALWMKARGQQVTQQGHRR